MISESLNTTSKTNNISPKLFSIKKRIFHQIQPKRNDNNHTLRLGTFYYNRQKYKQKTSKTHLEHISTDNKLNEYLRDEVLEKLCTESNVLERTSNIKDNDNNNNNIVNPKILKNISISPNVSSQSVLNLRNKIHAQKRIMAKKKCIPSSFSSNISRRGLCCNLVDTIFKLKDNNVNVTNNDNSQQYVLATSPNSFRNSNNNNENKVNSSSCTYLKPSVSPIIKKRKENLFLNNNNTEINNEFKITMHKTKHTCTLPKLPTILTPHNSYRKFTIPNNNNNNIHSINYSSLSHNGFILEQQLEKTNQDRLLILPNILNIPNFSTYAVLDGHGQNGHFISELSKDFLYSYYNNSTLYYLPRNTSNLQMKSLNGYITSNDAINKLILNNYDILSKSIKQLQQKIKSSEFETEFSGTTLCQVFISDNKIICINIGDSRALLISKETTFPLSIDHKPVNEMERKRIEKQGGEIHKNEANVGCDRVYVRKQKYPGIAMSRSLGDLIAKSIGVSCEPDFKEITISNNDIGVLIASDGIWEGISNDYVGKVFREGYKRKDSSYIVNTLYTVAKEAFINKKENVDDISAIAIFL